jgi:carbamoyltransferase
VLLNTSFNGPKEPIVETPNDAISTFLEIGLDFLIIDNFLISKK